MRLISLRRTGMGAAGIVVGIVGIGFPGCWRKSVGIAQIGRDTVQHPLLGAVRIQGADHLPAWVVDHHRLLTELGIAGGGVLPALAVKRLVFFDHLAFVVIDLPAADQYIGAIGVAVAHTGKRQFAAGFRRFGRWVKCRRRKSHRRNGFPRIAPAFAVSGQSRRSIRRFL